MKKVSKFYLFLFCFVFLPIGYASLYASWHSFPAKVTYIVDTLGTSVTITAKISMHIGFVEGKIWHIPIAGEDLNDTILLWHGNNTGTLEKSFTSHYTILPGDRVAYRIGIECRYLDTSKTYAGGGYDLYLENLGYGIVYSEGNFDAIEEIE